MGISLDSFTEATGRAYRDAELFLQSHRPDELLKQPQHPELRKIADIKRYALLVTFVADQWGLTVQFRDGFPKKGFASWLYALGGGSYAIALDARQLNVWEQETKMPSAAQRIRSVAHELGHYHLSVGVQPDPSGRPFFTAASAEEEEKAWCYALSFLGVILGRYSFLARTEQDVDDAPKLFV